jgi:hypothetical protein
MMTPSFAAATNRRHITRHDNTRIGQQRQQVRFDRANSTMMRESSTLVRS